MSPQFVDFDADGHTDIVTAVWEGVVYLVRGSKDGWLPPQHVLDREGRTIILSRHYDFKKRGYFDADRSPKGAAKKNAKEHLVGATAFDWDGDGDFDLLLCGKQGGLYLQRNEGKAGAPSFTGENELLKAGGKDFKVPGGLTAARLVDWDKDGVMDLVCGSFGGGVYLYRNGGKAGAPAFEAPVTLLAVRKNDGAPTYPTSGVYADPVDVDGDGDLDLLVGGYANYAPKQVPLTDEQKAKLAALDKERNALYATFRERYTAFSATLKGKSADEQRKLRTEFYRSAESRAHQKKLREVSQAIGKLRPSPKRQAGVWLFRRN